MTEMVLTTKQKSLTQPTNFLAAKVISLSAINEVGGLP